THFGSSAFRPRFPHLATVHAHLPGKSTKLCKVIQRCIRSRVVFRQKIHEIDMAKVVAADIVIEFEIPVVITKIPVAGGLYAVDETAVMQDREVEPGAVPADQARRIPFNGLEEAV